jgi:hypothetical protein
MVGLHGVRDEHLCRDACRRTVELRIGNADDRQATGIDINGAPDDLAIRAELAAPQTVGDHGYRRTAPDGMTECRAGVVPRPNDREGCASIGARG